MHSKAKGPEKIFKVRASRFVREGRSLAEGSLIEIPALGEAEVLVAFRQEEKSERFVCKNEGEGVLSFSGPVESFTLRLFERQGQMLVSGVWFAAADDRGDTPIGTWVADEDDKDGGGRGGGGHGGGGHGGG